MLRDLFKKNIRTSREYQSSSVEIPSGMWRKCNKCKAPVYTDDVLENLYICPKCGGYFRMPAFERIEALVDEQSFEEWDREVSAKNPLSFPGYEKKIQHSREKTGLLEAIVTGKAKINQYPLAIGVMDSRFMMGSMGQAVGEKITRLFERALTEKLPVVLFCCSGGARMQEGMISLMQMAKTSAAIKKHSKAGLLYIPVLTDPTTGGVTASFAMLGDIILAEPGSLIGFAGPRVIAQTIGQKLPEGFQRAEFLQEHGFIDKVVKREEMREVLADLLRLHLVQKKIKIQIPRLEDILETQTEKKDAWEEVLLSRKRERASGIDYIEQLFSEFIEFHGDRLAGDDPAIVGGIANFHGTTVTVIVQQKGNSTKENIARNFGMPSPQGYRKALRLMKQAEKFSRPVLCLVDTPGAFCGVEAEEDGQGEAIARNLLELSELKVPVLSIVIGEGGSGGALALAVADEVWMLEHSIYSILSPEGFSTILWKDNKRADEAARLMKMTAKDLLDMGLIEKIIPEKKEATPDHLGIIINYMEREILSYLKEYQALSTEELIAKRYERYRKF